MYGRILTQWLIVGWRITKINWTADRQGIINILNVADADTGYINNLHVLRKTSTSTTTGTDEVNRLQEKTRSAKKWEQ